MALGVLLDKTIKIIHSFGEKSYQATPERLIGAVRYAAKKIIEEEKQSPKQPNFNTATVEFLTEEVLTAAENIFVNYLKEIKALNKSLGGVPFLQKTVKIDGERYKLWGGPDTLEMGEDGIPEIIDYKSRQDITKGKQNMDMDLMPKLYTLLMSENLLKKGYKKARFKVKFWQDPLDESFSIEYNLEDLLEVEEIFKEKIKKIKQNKQISFCLLQFCEACNHPESDDFMTQLENLGYSLE